MNKIIILRGLLVFIFLIACLTAGIDYPINSEIMKFYFSGIRLNGYIMATCLAIIIGVLPKLIGWFNNNPNRLYFRTTIVLALFLFFLILYAQLQAGYGLFTIILVIICFILNTLLCLAYYDLKAKYAPEIKEYLLNKTSTSLRKKAFLVGEEIKKVKTLSKKEAEMGLLNLIDTTKANLNSITAKRDGLQRRRKQELDQLKALVNSIDDDIDSAYHSFDK